MKNRNFAVLLFSVMMLCVSVCLSAGEKSLDDGPKVTIRVPSAAGLLDATVFSPDVNAVLIKGEEGVIAVSGLFEKMKFTLLPPDFSGDVSCRALSADAQMAAVGSADGITLTWRKDQKGTSLKSWKFYEGGKVSSLAFSVDGEALAAGTTDGKVVLWDVLALKRDKVAQQFPKPPQRYTAIVTCLGFSPNNRLLIAGYEDGSVRLWDTQTRELLKPFNKLEERGSIRCFSFSADSKELAIGTSEGMVGFWDSGSKPKGIWRVFKDSKSVSVSSVSICGKDNQIVVAVGGQSGQVKRLFNVKNRVKLRPISTSTLSNVIGLGFSKDGEKLVTLHRDREVRFWHPSDFDLEVSPHPTVALVGSAWPRVDGPQIAFLDDFVRPIRDDFGGSDRSRGFDRQSILRGTIRGLVGVREVHVHGSKSVVRATLDGDTFEAKLPLHSLVGGVTVTAVGDNEKSVSEQYQPYDRRGKDYALLIGVAKYDNFSGEYSAKNRPDLQLGNAAHDVEALDKVLKKEYGFVTYPLINPNSREIKTEIANFVKADHPEDAQLLIFYAGHGIIFDEGKGGCVHDMGDKTSHIFGSDTAAPQPLLHDKSLWRGDKKEVFEFKERTYDLANLRSLIARNAHNVLVILDACNSGTIDDAVAAGDSLSDPSDLRDNSQASFKEKLLSRTQQYLTSASKEDAKDAAFANKDNSPFTDQLVNALRENASAGTILTFSELWEYFRKNRFHKDQKNAEQTPQTGVLSNRHEKDGDFLFIPPHRL
jgi:WD40 repeat protein